MVTDIFCRSSEGSVNQAQHEVYSTLLTKAGEEDSAVGTGPDCTSASQLPSHSDVHDSIFTKRRIQVSVFCTGYSHS